ncbi:lysophospholipid acyltransferase family protein [Botrimarina hoheduenensis]|uniref:Acyltransferase n=1 Tax=Botrimarina hoheduenensis TaxID=2528000 RepID=A0A5C5VZJ7_9BACT|nr:1-acyl-sn-glycerol-3-phosphate acyltransferase [Botrimarina hoheduenensis]TWT43201.1 Acyltransferase [Botrimarina hoheduenensis]
MQEIVLEEPYEFVPPVESSFWCWLVRLRLPGYLRKTFCVESFEFRGIEKLKQSIASGHGVILAANHSRLADPMAVGMLAAEAGCELFAMASWHLFKEGWWQRFLIRRMGAFSVYREGNDRQSVTQAIEVLEQGRRPLLIFPEGAVSRHCDLVMELMDGPGFIARQASKRRAKAGRPPVVIHPVTIRYSYDGDAEQLIRADVEAFEKSFSWQPQTQLTLHQRLRKIGVALLTLKEVEYLGSATEGDPHERAQGLISKKLDQLEKKWGLADEAAENSEPNNIVARVKRIRTKILPDLVAKKVSSAERQDRWHDLAACYYLQQIAHYPRGYLTGTNDLPERVIETVERMIEDYQDRASYHGPLHCTLVVGDAIEAPDTRERGVEGDPLMRRVAADLQSTLDALVDERRAKLFGSSATSD